VIVERLASRERDAKIELSAVLRWGDGQAKVSVTVPAELAGEPEDASPFLPLALVPSLMLGEDVVVDAPVSPLLLRGARRAVELYRHWCPPLHDSAIEVAEERECVPRAPALGCFFSRGVDSTFSALTPRSYPGEVEGLISIHGFHPLYDEQVTAEEIRRAGAAAEKTGLPLSVVEVSFWDAVRHAVGDADDVTAASLALAALSLPGGFGTILVPPSDSPETLVPLGTHAILEPLFSTEAVSLHYDSVPKGRVDKTMWIARERPDLLPDLKVCAEQNRPDNCGRCHKCLLVMGALEAAGGLRAASQFPDEIDLEDVDRANLETLQRRVEWAQLVRRLDRVRHGELRARILRLLDVPAGSFTRRPPRSDTPDFRQRHFSQLIAAVRYGRPWPPPDDLATPPGYGLVCAIAPGRGAHVYGVGGVPPGSLVGELGSLAREASFRATDPVWLTAGGYLVTASARATGTPASPAARLRWLFAPLFWRDVSEPLGVRLRAILWRAGNLLRRGDGRSAAPIAVVGHVYREASPERLPLHSAIHPVTGDQLLSTNPWEANDMGYGAGERLGYIDPGAPVTGRALNGRPRLPWASRFGQRVRIPGETPISGGRSPAAERPPASGLR
jgi:hypothetical protein